MERNLVLKHNRSLVFLNFLNFSFFFFFFYFFFHTHFIWKFPGQGSSQSYSCQPQQCQIPASSVTYTTAHSNTKSRDQTCNLIVLSRIRFHCTTTGTPFLEFSINYECMPPIFVYLKISFFFKIFIYFFFYGSIIDLQPSVSSRYATE